MQFGPALLQGDCLKVVLLLKYLSPLVQEKSTYMCLCAPRNRFLMTGSLKFNFCFSSSCKNNLPKFICILDRFCKNILPVLQSLFCVKKNANNYIVERARNTS